MFRQFRNYPKMTLDTWRGICITSESKFQKILTRSAGPGSAFVYHELGLPMQHTVNIPTPPKDVPKKEGAPSTSRADRASEHKISPNSIDYTPPLLTAFSVVFSLFGTPVSPQALRAGIPYDGTVVTPEQCIRGAAEAGMRARIVKRRLDKIPPLVLPCILLLKNGNSCVLTQLSDGKAKVVFPEIPDSSRMVTLEELEDIYLGYAIFCRPKERSDKRTRELDFIQNKKWYWGTILKFWPIYKHIIPASIMVNVLALASPLFVMNVYDRVVPNTALDTLWMLALGVITAYTFDFILRNLRSYFVDTAGKNADVIIASKLMKQLLAIKLDKKPESTGTLANNLREFESLREFFSSTTLLAFIDLPFVAIFIAIIAALGGPVAIAPALAVPAVILIGIILQYPFQKVIASSYKENARKNALIIESIGALETIKANSAEGQILKNWEEAVGRSAVSSGKAKTLSNLSITLSQFTAHLVSAVIIVWGVYRIGDGLMTLGGLIACNILAGRAMAPLGAIAAMLTRLQQSRMALKSLDLLMQLPNERPAGRETVAQIDLEPSVEFEGVNFQYPESQVLSLNQVHLNIAAGEKVGIIGRMGSGKSTLGKLILGLNEPQAGSIRVGGIDIRQLDTAELRKRIGFVSQDPNLLFGTVRDSIVLGAPHMDDQTILRAANLACVTDFVRNHPAGFGLPVGERGANLSGGQRQSVALARALLLDPDILILDEPTSSMDNRTEAIFKTRIKPELEDKTLLLITHRRSMLSLVDRLIVMDGGRVLADGPKNSILRALHEGSVTKSPNH